MAELPDLVEVARDHADGGLRVVALAMDAASPLADAAPPEAVAVFAAERELDLEVLYYRDPTDELGDALGEAFGVSSGALPVTLVLDGAGDVVIVHEGPATREQFAALARAALE